jgi:hypothetical protein
MRLLRAPAGSAHVSQTSKGAAILPLLQRSGEAQVSKLQMILAFHRPNLGKFSALLEAIRIIGLKPFTARLVANQPSFRNSVQNLTRHVIDRQLSPPCSTALKSF